MSAQKLANYLAAIMLSSWAGLCLKQVISAMSLLGLWNLTLVEPWIVGRPTSHLTSSSNELWDQDGEVYLNISIPLR